MNDEVLHSKTKLSWLPYFDNKSIGISFRCIHRGFLLLKEMQYIDKLLQNFSPSEVLIKKKMISRKILVMITLFFYLEDWIYKRITHLKS
jgi:DNA mismatch repair protein MutS